MAVTETSTFCAGAATTVETGVGEAEGAETLTFTVLAGCCEAIGLTGWTGFAAVRTVVTSSFWGQKRIRRIAITRRMIVNVGQWDLTKFHEDENTFAVWGWLFVVAGTVTTGVEGVEGVDGVEGVAGVVGFVTATGPEGVAAAPLPFCAMPVPVVPVPDGVFAAMLPVPPPTISFVIAASVFVMPPRTAAIPAWLLVTAVGFCVML